MTRYLKMSQKQHIFVALCILTAILLFALGAWQIKRYDWKISLIKQIEENSKKPALSFPLKENNLKKAEFRNIELEGKYLHSDSIFISAKYYRGKLGYHLITPMELGDNTLVLINRGWVPSQQKNEKKGSVYRPVGKVKLKGIIRKGDHVRWFAPKNDPKNNKWFWTYLDDLLLYTRANNENRVVRPLLVQVIEENSDKDFPIVASHSFKVRNYHIQYAITWFSLAIITLVMCFLYIRKENSV